MVCADAVKAYTVYTYRIINGMEFGEALKRDFAPSFSLVFEEVSENMKVQ